MLNYMKSEWYRTLRNKKLYGFVGICIALMCTLVFALRYFMSDPTFPYAHTEFALRGIYMCMDMMMVVATVFVALMHDNEDKHHTIKHSVAFGIKRSTIYIGRFLVQVMVSCLIYVVVIGLLVGLSYTFLPITGVGEFSNLLRISAGSITCLFAALALTHLLLMISENQMTAYIISVALVFVVPSLCSTIGRKVDIVGQLSRFLPTNVVSAGGPLVVLQGSSTSAVLFGLIVGLVWVGIFLGLGITAFNRMEVK